ncbi:MAG: spore coat U domain-containing protein [Caenibius sp.]
MTMNRHTGFWSRARLIRCLIVLFAFPVFSLLTPGKAHALVSCSVDSASISFGTAQTATGTVDYSCVQLFEPGTINVCVAIGSPSTPGTPAQPKMANGANALNFNVYRNAARTQVWNNAQPLQGSMTLSGWLSSSPGSIPFYGQIPSGQSVPAGAYDAKFNSTILTFGFGSGCPQAGNADPITVFVYADVPNSCTVTALGDADLGIVSATAGATYGNTSVRVNCPRDTPYTIGLTPSNGNSSGLGALSGTGSNTDKPPYQLRKTSNTGPIWGQAVSPTNAGNGQSGTGTGANQTYPVYVSVPSPNYTPDQYSDTVTVTLNF